jgi:hypothetical protein
MRLLALHEDKSEDIDPDIGIHLKHLREGGDGCMLRTYFNHILTEFYGAGQPCSAHLIELAHFEQEDRVKMPGLELPPLLLALRHHVVLRAPCTMKKCEKRQARPGFIYI